MNIYTTYNVEDYVTEDTVNEISDELYNRQKELNLNIPEEATILGLGGIGSWMAIYMALVGVKRLHLIDFDVIEKHNLNRTLFRDVDIDTQKTEAVLDLILERRLDTEVRIFNKRIEEFHTMELKDLGNSIILDCRDVLEELPEQLKDNQHIKLSYDGLSITVMINPDYTKVWGNEENNGYEITPSFLVPCSFLAGLATMLLCDPEVDITTMKDKSVTFDLNKHFAKVINDDS